jgi:hypothetical protein
MSVVRDMLLRVQLNPTADSRGPFSEQKPSGRDWERQMVEKLKTFDPDPD